MARAASQRAVPGPRYGRTCDRRRAARLAAAGGKFYDVAAHLLSLIQQHIGSDVVAPAAASGRGRANSEPRRLLRTTSTTPLAVKPQAHRRRA
jgi:hypothetical protein